MTTRQAKFWLLIAAICCQASSGLALDDKDVALMLKTKGDVQLGKAGRSFAPARRGSRIDSGEMVRTGDNSLAALMFTDDRSQLKIRANSNVTINGKREKQGIVKRLSLRFGELWAKVTKQQTEMRVETPSGVATVKGTELNALFEDDTYLVYVREGLVELANQLGALLLRANEMGRIRRGQPPERVQGNPDDFFQLGTEAQIEIDFQDEDGNQKTLILNFGDQ